MPQPILSVEKVDLGYGNLTVVFDLSLHVDQGELVGLVGGNGSGKSTVLRAISGMIRPRSGRILFDGEEVSGAKPHQMAERGLAHVPMGRQLFPNMSVLENLMLGAYLPKARAKRDAQLEHVYSLFPDLAAHAKAPAGALSGGQQQMVAIGRALMLGPKMLIMDEPSLGLSPILVKEVMGSIRRVAQTGLPILLVEQNVKQVLAVSDRAYVLENGRQVLDGPAAELQGHPMIKKAYLGL
ncbi:ABC transporter ATP-binding protein [Aquibaculum sediminis]|uniref:ABC transporter ATP-binding protein n=1 Tax=Aquibaculum sediminis TaxID=3231907 RepID=UPI00345441CA